MYKKLYLIYSTTPCCVPVKVKIHLMQKDLYICWEPTLFGSTRALCCNSPCFPFPVVDCENAERWRGLITVKEPLDEKPCLTAVVRYITRHHCLGLQYSLQAF